MVGRMLLFLAVAHEPLVPARAKCDTWQVTHKLTPCLISLSRTVQRSELNLPRSTSWFDVSAKGQISMKKLKVALL